MDSAREGFFESFVGDQALLPCWLRHKASVHIRLCLPLVANENIEASAHVGVIEVGSCKRVLVLSAGVVVEVDSFVVVIVWAIPRFFLLYFFLGLVVHRLVGPFVVEVVFLLVAPKIRMDSAIHLKRLEGANARLPLRMSRYLINLNMFGSHLIRRKTSLFCCCSISPRITMMWIAFDTANEDPYRSSISLANIEYFIFCPRGNLLRIDSCIF